ncbi:uncharacterized protein LOC128859390 [Anastrepha ludens]|uniref:uncharacterized protein LOC128859390 n=1 Tax=Anastrepha ludens TaxID=28586 RepID=UPI0023B078D9|nr:uncharacterized protein LOC128859390 [Anastrepha ludens]
MADRLSEVPPPSKPFPGSLTPGWNDPPPINDVSRPAGRTRLNLNKRVAFPVQSATTTNSSENSPKSTVFARPNLPPVGNVPVPPTLSAHPKI